MNPPPPSFCLETSHFCFHLVHPISIIHFKSCPGGCFNKAPELGQPNDCVQKVLVVFGSWQLSPCGDTSCAGCTRVFTRLSSCVFQVYNSNKDSQSEGSEYS